MFKKKAHHSRAAERPNHSAAGLSSKVNRRYVLDVLNHSTPDEVTRLLAEARYTDRANISIYADQIKAEVRRLAEAYMASAAGRAEASRLKHDMAKREAETWLMTEQGRLALGQAKARLAARELLKDGDIFERACRAAIDEHVSAWLASPAGREAIEQARLRKVKKSTESTQKQSWITKYIQQMEGQGDG
jgi:hypothetical protein